MDAAEAGTGRPAAAIDGPLPVVSAAGRLSAAIVRRVGAAAGQPPQPSTGVWVLRMLADWPPPSTARWWPAGRPPPSMGVWLRRLASWPPPFTARECRGSTARWCGGHCRATLARCGTREAVETTHPSFREGARLRSPAKEMRSSAPPQPPVRWTARPTEVRHAEFTRRTQ